MKTDLVNFSSNPREDNFYFLPATIVGIGNFFVIILLTILLQPRLPNFQKIILVAIGILGCAYISLSYQFYSASNNKYSYTWLNAFISGSVLGLFVRIVPTEVEFLVHSLFFISVLASSIISERGPSYMLISIVVVWHSIEHIADGTPPLVWFVHGVLNIVTFVIVETVHQLKIMNRKQISRLEIINEISKQIVSTLDTKELIALLEATLLKVIEADTYLLGVKKDDKIDLLLFYDDGEFYQNLSFEMEGSLSSWVIENRSPLFLPDLRKPPNINVRKVIAGGSKSSLTWMGVPMAGTHVNGLIAIASYRPNAFNHSDFELLINIAQRAALALDNTYHHALVEEEARLDSLTRVYNHGYFIKSLQMQAEESLQLNQPLSLIMLDIDFFKKYNDTYGHSAGDEILVGLCEAIRSNIKQTDAVGRWGGEEFAILLPNTNSQQALQVATRIRQTLAQFKINKPGFENFPTPTISIGIAIYPVETNNIMSLIDLADRRLYIAKERGRDQIETAPSL